MKSLKLRDIVGGLASLESSEEAAGNMEWWIQDQECRTNGVRTTQSCLNVSYSYQMPGKLSIKWNKRKRRRSKGLIQEELY